MKIRKANQIKLYFIIGIGLPCILLSYFAYRGVRNDRALMEEELAKNHRKIVNGLVKEFDDKFAHEAQLLQSFIQNTDDNKFPANYNSSSIVKNQDFVRAIFRIASTKHISFLYPKLLYHLDNINHNYILTKNKKVHQIINKARQLEFSDKNYKGAIQLYHSALSRDIEDQTKGLLLNSIARAQKKDAQLNNSISTYHDLIKTYDRVIANNGIPFGLAARIELGSLFLSKRDTLQALDIYLQAYQNLAEGIWVIQNSQFDFFEIMVRDSLKKIISNHKKKKDFVSIDITYSKLKNGINERKQVADYLLLFKKYGYETVAQKTGLNNLEIINSPSQLYLEIQGNKYLIDLINEKNQLKKKVSSLLGVLWDINNFKDLYLNSLLKNKITSSSVCWRVIDENNKIILKNEQFEPGKLMVRTNFINYHPPWSIELYQKESNIIYEVGSLGKSIYFYMLILVAGILGFGLILTSISITREIEIAKLKSDFASTISHELRSPLTSIRQLAEMLQTGRVPSNERRQKYYQVIVEQSEKLSMLINNILDFTKIEERKRKFDFELISFSEFLRNILSTIKKRVEHENFDLEIDVANGLPKILVDRDAMTQVITNLVDNAIKYSDDVKKIIIRAHLKNNSIYVCVQDFGIGINEHDLIKIYNRFFRGGDVSVRSKTKGSGLGLTLVKQIIEAHNGEIKVKSELGKGSSFTIKLPI